MRGGCGGSSGVGGVGLVPGGDTVGQRRRRFYNVEMHYVTLGCQGFTRFPAGFDGRIVQKVHTLAEFVAPFREIGCTAVPVIRIVSEGSCLQRSWRTTGDARRIARRRSR